MKINGPNSIVPLPNNEIKEHQQISLGCHKVLATTIIRLGYILNQEALCAGRPAGEKNTNLQSKQHFSLLICNPLITPIFIWMGDWGGIKKGLYVYLLHGGYHDEASQDTNLFKKSIFSGCIGQIRKKNEVVSIGNYFALSPTHCGRRASLL